MESLHFQHGNNFTTNMPVEEDFSLGRGRCDCKGSSATRLPQSQEQMKMMLILRRIDVI
jgi:hypothetical protein